MSSEYWVRRSDDSSSLRCVMSRANEKLYSTPLCVTYVAVTSTGKTSPDFVRWTVSKRSEPSALTWLHSTDQFSTVFVGSISKIVMPSSSSRV